MVIFSIGFIILFGWLFKKLSSENIKEEFIAPETILPVN
jgi:flagellar biogenesis protein FliO